MLDRERRSGIGILTLNRSEAGNSISSGLTTELLSALDDLETDTTLQAVIVTCAGGWFFCSGDVKEYRERSSEVIPR